MVRRRIAAIAVATLGRAAFGGVLLVVVLVRLPAGEAVEVFQLLVLQAVLSTVLSGSAFARGLADGGAPEAGAAGLRALGAIWAGLTALAALVLALMPAGFRAAHVSDEGGTLALLALGALAAALTAALQGMLAGRAGPVRVFVAPGAAFFAMAGAAVLAPVSSSGGALGLLVATQALGLAALLAAAPGGWALLARAVAPRRLALTAPQLRETLAVGAINGAGLLAVFALRAWWSGVVPENVAERVFFAMRLSDIWMQIAYYAIAMSGRLERMRLHDPGAEAPGARLRIGAVTAGLGAAAALAAIAAAPGAAAAGGAAGMALLIGVQMLVDASRLPSSALLASAVRARRLARLGALSLGSVIGAALLAAALTPALPAAAMFLYQIAVGALTTGLWILLSLRKGAA